uniref:Large ribosomal subunit protein eL14 n=1 Tax=Mus spicilegus TaxID=10103 RepID=A0A8C6GMG9_MUSSI
MIYRALRYMEVGRVAYISFGPHPGKLVATVGVIDQKRVLATPFKCMQLTGFILEFPHSARQNYVRKAWEKAGIDAKWAATRWAKKIGARERLAKMTDFDRLKVMKKNREGWGVCVHKGTYTAYMLVTKERLSGS